MALPAHSDPNPMRRLPRVRFSWGTKGEVRGEWYAGLFGYHVKGFPKERWILVSVRGLLLWTTGTALAAYLSGAAALTYVLSKNPYNRLDYADFVLPTNWSDLRHKRGLSRIDEGLHELRTGNFYGGALLLQAGLNSVPEDMRARIALGQIFARIGYINRSMQLMRDGLPYVGGRQSYLRILFQIANYLEDYQSVLEVSDQLLQHPEHNDPGLERWLIEQRVQVMEKLQMDEEIIALHQSRAAAPLIILDQAWVRIMAKRGNGAEALRVLVQHPDRFGLKRERLELMVLAARSAHEQSTVNDALHEWQLLEPNNPKPRIEEIVDRALAPDGERAVVALLQGYLNNFGSDPANVSSVLKKLDELPDIRWINLAWHEAREAGADSLKVQIVYVQGLIAHGNIDDAQREFASVRDTIQSKHLPDGGWLDGTSALLEFLANDSPTNRGQLLAFAAHKQLPPSSFRFIERSLLARGFKPMADEIVSIAQNRFPSFQQAQAAKQVAVVPVANDDIQNPNTKKLTPAEARVELSRLEADLQAKRWAEASVRLSRIDKAGVVELQPALLLSRVRLFGAQSEQAELTSALQLYLNLPGVDLSSLRDLATDWKATARLESLRTLLRIVTTKMPSARWAQELRKQLNQDTKMAPVELPVPETGGELKK